MLTKGGVDVEVFSAGAQGTGICEASCVPVHRVPAKNRDEFSARIAPVFVAQHRFRPFDVLESPEIGAEGGAVAAALPEVARVVKLHTPNYLIGRFGYEPPTMFERLRFSLGALRRGRIAYLRRDRYDSAKDKECSFAKSADEIASLSRTIGTIVGHDWRLPADRISIFPLPFLADPRLLALPPAGVAGTVGFLGRMEPRKGIVELAQAIPLILRRARKLRFRFIGPSWPFKQGDMRSWIESHFSDCRGAMEFVGEFASEDLSKHLGQCDIMLLPSRWENFPSACIESMAAGRAVIGSASGGMAEMIEHGKTGLLVPPRNPKAVAEAVLSLVRNPAQLRLFAEAGRKSIVEQLSPERVFPFQMASYQRAITRCRERVSRDG